MLIESIALTITIIQNWFRLMASFGSCYCMKCLYLCCVLIMCNVLSGDVCSPTVHTYVQDVVGVASRALLTSPVGGAQSARAPPPPPRPTATTQNTTFLHVLFLLLRQGTSPPAPPDRVPSGQSYLFITIIAFVRVGELGVRTGHDNRSCPLLGAAASLAMIISCSIYFHSYKRLFQNSSNKMAIQSPSIKQRFIVTIDF